MHTFWDSSKSTCCRLSLKPEEQRLFSLYKGNLILFKAKHMLEIIKTLHSIVFFSHLKQNCIYHNTEYSYFCTHFLESIYSAPFRISHVEINDLQSLWFSSIFWKAASEAVCWNAGAGGLCGSFSSFGVRFVASTTSQPYHSFA